MCHMIRHVGAVRYGGMTQVKVRVTGRAVGVDARCIRPAIRVRLRDLKKERFLLKRRPIKCQVAESDVADKTATPELATNADTGLARADKIFKHDIFNPPGCLTPERPPTTAP